MTHVDDSVLKPGTGIDLVINLHSLTPLSSSSVIFESDTKRKILIVARPEQRLNIKDLKSNTLHVSALARDKAGKINRIGFLCTLAKCLESYRLANGTTTQALVLSYTPKAELVTVRSAFRYIPSSTHEALGKMVIAGHDFFSGKDFRISDISLAGVGLILPKEVNRCQNPLTALDVGRIARFGIVLRDHTQESETIEAIETIVEVRRINRRFNEKAIFVGCRFNRISSACEEILCRFIHNAQLHEIRSMTHA